eukprot:Clim_evm29s207 gene=Clim_evmTU29s207
MTEKVIAPPDYTQPELYGLLKAWHEKHGARRLKAAPKVQSVGVDLYILFQCVRRAGGPWKVDHDRKWKWIAMEYLNLPRGSETPILLRRCFDKWIAPAITEYEPFASFAGYNELRRPEDKPPPVKSEEDIPETSVLQFHDEFEPLPLPEPSEDEEDEEPEPRRRGRPPKNPPTERSASKPKSAKSADRVAPVKQEMHKPTKSQAGEAPRPRPQEKQPQRERTITYELEGSKTKKRRRMEHNLDVPEYLAEQMYTASTPSFATDYRADVVGHVNRAVGGSVLWPRLHKNGKAGVLSSLTFALQSGLVNEINWAFTCLVLLSYEDMVSTTLLALNDFGVIPVMMEHADEFIKHPSIIYCKPDEKSLPDPPIPPELESAYFAKRMVYEGTFAHGEQDNPLVAPNTGAGPSATENDKRKNRKLDTHRHYHAKRTERIKQIALVLRNFSFEHAMSPGMARIPKVLEFCIQCLKTDHIELRRDALETLVNLAYDLRFSRTPEYFKKILRGVCDQFLGEKGARLREDQRQLRSMVSFIGRVLSSDSNWEAIQDDQKYVSALIKTLIDLINTTDPLVLCNVLECLYGISQANWEVNHQLSGNPALLQQLVALLNFRLENMTLMNPAIETKPAMVDDVIVDHQAMSLFSAAYIQHLVSTPSDSETGGKVFFGDIYSDYCSFAAEVGFEVLDSSTFGSLLRVLLTKAQMVYDVNMSGIVVSGVRANSPEVREKLVAVCLNWKQLWLNGRVGVDIYNIKVREEDLGVGFRPKKPERKAETEDQEEGKKAAEEPMVNGDANGDKPKESKIQEFEDVLEDDQVMIFHRRAYNRPWPVVTGIQVPFAEMVVEGGKRLLNRFLDPLESAVRLCSGLVLRNMLRDNDAAKAHVHRHEGTIFEASMAGGPETFPLHECLQILSTAK